MALNSRSAIDPRWLSHNIPVVRSLALSTIEIFDAGSSSSTYDPVTNTWTGEDTTLWSGKARIQPRGNRTSSAGGAYNINDSAKKVFEIHIGLRENQVTGSNGAMPDLRPGHKIKVTASPADESMLNYEFVIASVLNSSNPWHRMLLCEANEEINPNNG